MKGHLQQLKAQWLLFWHQSVLPNWHKLGPELQHNLHTWWLPLSALMLTLGLYLFSRFIFRHGKSFPEL
jgi:hypothetical protein